MSRAQTSANADFVMREYLRLSAAAASPPGRDPLAMQGYRFLRRCSACGGSKWKKDGRGVWRCQRLVVAGGRRRRKRGSFKRPCAALRPTRTAAIPKGFFQENARKNSGSFRVERLAQFGFVFRVLTEPQQRAFSTYVRLGSYAKAAAYARDEWPHLCWTESVLRRLVKEARQRVEERLERRARYDEALA